jgi:MoaA/NifB/PqqE/SkfB family radical SAM enzyme
MNTPIIKNRQRSAYSFANINLLGQCNANCYFCLGKDILQELSGKNQLNVHFSQWKNFPQFLNQCRLHKISNLYITGQTADGLQYQYLEDLVDYLQSNDFVVGVRTNGLLALQKMDIIKSMKGEIGYSIHSLSCETNKKIMGTCVIPDWVKIIPASGDNVRVSIVICRHNIDEIDDIIYWLSHFKNIKYIQLRRISTDTRLPLLQKDIDVFEEYYRKISIRYSAYKIGDFNLAQRYVVYGKEICFWRTVETTCNSLNYFTDGVCSDEYFIVEGYLKNSI